jgi:uncharacterized membrane protein
MKIRPMAKKPLTILFIVILVVGFVLVDIFAGNKYRLPANIIYGVLIITLTSIFYMVSLTKLLVLVKLSKNNYEIMQKDIAFIVTAHKHKDNTIAMTREFKSNFKKAVTQAALKYGDDDTTFHTNTWLISEKYIKRLDNTPIKVEPVTDQKYIRRNKRIIKVLITLAYRKDKRQAMLKRLNDATFNHYSWKKADAPIFASLYDRKKDGADIRKS